MATEIEERGLRSDERIRGENPANGGTLKALYEYDPIKVPRQSVVCGPSIVSPFLNVVVIKENAQMLNALVNKHVSVN